MASRALLRRRKYLLNSLNQPSWSSRGFPNFEHDNTSKADNPHILHRFAWHSSSDDTERTNEAVLYSTARHEVSLLTRMGLVGRNTFQVPHSLLSTGWGNYSSICWFRQLSQSRHYSSVATASQSAPSSGNDKNEEDKKVKEASPEECDQAVEGLSSVKAKAKAKKLQESQKSEISVIKRIWSVVLGIGPALKAVASMSREDWANKLLHWKDEFKSTMQHYWLGTKLLWADVRISVRLLLKVARGKGLSRRERQQLTRTTVDIFRLVPFAVFIIVPFMEFLLPVFLKLFPNMLPSTFQDKMKEQEELKRRLTARMELAKFLQNTVKEMAKEVQNSQSGDIKKTAEDLDEFMNKVRKGARVSNDEILSFAKLFDDELTLDNISRPRLVNMCKYMGINPYGTDGYLRYMLQNRLRWIKNDDRMIQEEGVESLSEAELRQACRDRGLLVDEAVATPFRFLLKGARNPSSWLLTSLHDWLDLSLNHKVPSSRLILSRAFSASGKVKPEEAVQATLSSLPDEVVDTVQVTTLPSEDSVSERKRKLEFLEMQEERIKEEELAKMKDSTIREKDVALEEMTIPMAREAQEQKKAKALDKTEQLCELSRALAVLASASVMAIYVYS